MAQVNMVAFGSAGDIYPYLALGPALRAAGHDVTLLSSPVWAASAARAGIGFLSIGPEGDHDATLAHPKIWHRTQALSIFWRYLLRQTLLPTVETLRARREAGQLDVILANPLAMGARLAEETTGTPLISLYTAPMFLRSVHDPMMLNHLEVPAWVPRPLRRMAWNMLDRRVLDPLIRPALDEARTALGLAPLDTSVFGDWMHGRHAGLALFPPWFAPPQPDWPARIQMADFPFHEETDLPLDAELDAFLDDGEAPVAFTAGSAHAGGADFYRAAIAACTAGGRRGILLGVVPPDLANASPSVIVRRHVPFARLFPRLSAVVHHGGIGTIAQALRAGLPQIVVPHAYDQFDNALRVQTIGAGLHCRARDLDRLPQRLDELIENGETAATCRRWSARIREETAPNKLLALIGPLG